MALPTISASRSECAQVWIVNRKKSESVVGVYLQFIPKAALEVERRFTTWFHELAAIGTSHLCVTKDSSNKHMDVTKPHSSKTAKTGASQRLSGSLKSRPQESMFSHLRGYEALAETHPRDSWRLIGFTSHF